MEDDAIKSILKEHLDKNAVPWFEDMWEETTSTATKRKWKWIGIAAALLLLTSLSLIFIPRSVTLQPEAITTWQTPSDFLIGNTSYAALTEWKSPTQFLLNGMDTPTINKQP